MFPIFYFFHFIFFVTISNLFGYVWGFYAMVQHNIIQIGEVKLKEKMFLNKVVLVV